jgi:hypothetical protein
MKDLYICKSCFAIATPNVKKKGSLTVEIFLWALFLVPGMIYTSWRLLKREKTCPVCSSASVISMNSAKGTKFLNEMYSNRNTRFISKVLDECEEGTSRLRHRITTPEPQE